MSFEASLLSQLDRATEAVSDLIAKDGLALLKKTLDSSGFVKSPYLKDYEVFATVNRRGITFEILVSLEAVDIDPKTLEESADRSIQAYEDASERIYHILSRGGFDRVARMKDNRRAAPSALNRPKRTKNNLHQWGPKSSGYGPRSAFKTSQTRRLEHKLAMSAPRDMHIDRQGRLSVRFERQTRTTKSGEIHFPQGKFQGIVKKFMDELKQLILSRFSPELEKVLRVYLEQ